VADFNEREVPNMRSSLRRSFSLGPHFTAAAMQVSE